MFRGISIIRFAAIVVCLTASSLLVPGQDLGSTSGLFRSKSTKKATTATKKPAKKAAPKKSSTRRRTSKRKSSRSKRPTRRIASAKSKKAAKSREKTVDISKSSKAAKAESSENSNGDVVITVGKPSAEKLKEMFEDAIVKGNAARNRRQYDVAEKAYREASALLPSDSRAIYGVGNVFSDQQRWEEAEAAYRMALKTEPDDPMASLALSYVLTQPVVGTNIGERYEEAEKLAAKAIKANSRSALAYDQLGVAMELRGIIDETTEENYRKAITLDPSFALAYAHLGRLLRKQGRTAESSDAYREAIRLAASPPAMILVAEVMQSQQRYQDSEQLLREALRRDPKNPTGLYLLGRALTTRKSYEEAEEVLKKSVSVSPQSFVSYALLGSLYLQSGDFSSAEQTLIRAQTVVSENEKRRLALEFEMIGDALMRENRKNEAARLFRRALALDAEREILAFKLETATDK